MTKLRWNNPPSESDPARRQSMADGDPALWLAQRQAARVEGFTAQQYDAAKEEHAQLSRVLKSCLATEKRMNRRREENSYKGGREKDAARARRARKIEQTTQRLGQLDAILDAAKSVLVGQFTLDR